MARVCGRRMIDDKAATNTTMDRAASAMLSCDRESSVYFSRLISRPHTNTLSVLSLLSWCFVGCREFLHCSTHSHRFTEELQSKLQSHTRSRDCSHPSRTPTKRDHRDSISISPNQHHTKPLLSLCACLNHQTPREQTRESPNQIKRNETENRNGAAAEEPHEQEKERDYRGSSSTNSSTALR